MVEHTRGPRVCRWRLFESSSAELLCTLAVLGLLMAWDASRLDLALARSSGTAQGFALRDHWLLSALLHDASPVAALLLLLWLTAGIWWPTGILKQLGRWQRIQWVATTLLALVLISVLKQVSHTSCPWDMTEFGGHAAWVSHWAWHALDGGAGHCFPAGHASAGFAFIGGYFVLRRQLPRWAWYWFVGSLLAGLLLGAAQQLRGAHFMSDTAWTGWLCWTLAWLVDVACRRVMAVNWPGRS